MQQAKWLTGLVLMKLTNKDMKEHIYEHQLRFGATSTAVGLSPVSFLLPYDPLLEHRDRNKEQYYEQFFYEILHGKR